MAPIYVLSYTYKTVGLDGQLLLSSRVNLGVKIISRCAKTFSCASCMCVEGRLKQEKMKGCWFVSANHSSIYELFPYDLHIHIMHSEEVRQQFAKDQWANYQVAHSYNETHRAGRITVMHAFLPILATVVLEFRIFSHKMFILSKML